MIWFWIALAISISIGFCVKREICWYHYIWVLLPIENYGIQVAGAIIKPYMVFGVLIVLALWLKRRALTIDTTLFFLLFFAFFTDFLNGLITASIMQHIQMVICCYIFYAYSQLIDQETDCWRQIEDVAIALLIGFGAVFVIASFVPNMGGVSTVDRYADGMYLGYTQYGGGHEYRLRGFTIDPNACITEFLPGFCYAIYRFQEHTGWDKLRNALAVCIYVYNVILTNSRMALLFTVICFIAILFGLYKKTRNKVIWLVGLIVFITCIVVLDAIFNILGHLYNTILNVYLQRASLTDEAGRITIWIENITCLFEMNRWPWGVGQNQIQNYTQLGMPCHNTFLECVCGMGIFVGSAMSLYILSPLIDGLKILGRKLSNQDCIVPLYLSYGAVCLCLLAVDHLFNPSLWSLFFILRMRHSFEENVVAVEVHSADRKLLEQ